MAKLYHSQHGKFLSGLFYGLSAELPSGRIEELPTGRLVESGVVEKSVIHGIVVGEKEKNLHKCPVDKTHVSSRKTLGIEVTLRRGSHYADIIINDDYFIVSQRVVQALWSSGLSGVEFAPVSVLHNETGIQPPKLSCLTFPGADARRPRSIDPPEANHCIKCGNSPLFCQTCGFGKLGCFRCGADVFATEDEYGGPSDPRIVIARTPGPDEGPIIELHRWDGSDFFGGPFSRTITCRALDFLLRKHIGPFRAAPLRTDVSKMNAELKNKLEISRTPIP